MKTILIVDDEPAIRLSVAAAFRLRGFNAVAAENGAAALRAAQAERIDAALVDINMPGMDGFAVCRGLCELARAQGRELPVWMMTGACTTAASERAADAGARRLVSKPFDVFGLLKEIGAEVQGTEQPATAVP